MPSQPVALAHFLVEQDITRSLTQRYPPLIFSFESGQRLHLRTLVVLRPGRPDHWVIGGLGRLQKGAQKAKREAFYVVKLSLALGTGTAARIAKRDWDYLVGLLDPDRVFEVPLEPELWRSAKDAEGYARRTRRSQTKMFNIVQRLIRVARKRLEEDGHFTTYKVRNLDTPKPEVELRSVLAAAESSQISLIFRFGEESKKRIEEWVAYLDERSPLS